MVCSHSHSVFFFFFFYRFQLNIGAQCSWEACEAISTLTKCTHSHRSLCMKIYLPSDLLIQWQCHQFISFCRFGDAEDASKWHSQSLTFKSLLSKDVERWRGRARKESNIQTKHFISFGECECVDVDSSTRCMWITHFIYCSRMENR